MPADMYTVNRTKELILAFLKARGPSLPVHIARDVKTQPLFAAAFLSELYNEGKIKMSAMKIGSSSLYYLPDQAAQLENFAQYLNSREKEALLLLKQHGLLEDDSLVPVVRVALRSLKDFAIPWHMQTENASKLMWRYFQLSEQDAKSLSDKGKPKKEISERREEKPRALKVKSDVKPLELSLALSAAPAQIVKKTAQEFPFVSIIKSHLSKRDIHLIESIMEKKKEFHAKVKLNTPLGPQEYLLTAKEKKRLSEEDLASALKAAHAKKMPALLIAPGALDKKALSLLNEWKNFVKFEKLE